MTIKLQLEERLQALYDGLRESEATTWAIRGAIQELETIIIPMIEKANSEEDPSNEIDQGDE